MSQQETEKGMLELIAYMLTSARGLFDEPATYGPFRLLEGVSRLCELLTADNHPQTEELNLLKENIDTKKFTLMTDVNAFKALTDESVLSITHLLMKESEKTTTKEK